MNYEDLKAKGFVQNKWGEWCKPARRDLGGLGSAVRERDPAPALDRRDPVRKAGPCRVGHCLVEIISFRKRLLDSDNNVAGGKQERDQIAATLGVDDGDPNIRWEYAQVLTKGAMGTLIKISLSEHA